MPTRRLVLLLLLAAAAHPADVGPSNGALVIVGGAMRDPAIFERFLELAGGPDSPVVVIPTAGEEETYGPDWPGIAHLRKTSATNLIILHTDDRDVANTDAFVEPIRNARGVWFTGGRQWRLADAYLDTLVHRELEKLLARGGVIGGSSAGATIQGSYLARGDTATNVVMMGDHERGFAFLKNVAIDQHLLRRNRQFDLIEIVKARPELLGIGIDEDAAIVVKGDAFEVIGQGYVAIYDAAKSIPPYGLFYLLAPGDKYNLNSREATRDDEPAERVKEIPWND
jgi:cyanophycinase